MKEVRYLMAWEKGRGGRRSGTWRKASPRSIRRWLSQNGRFMCDIGDKLCERESEMFPWLDNILAMRAIMLLTQQWQVRPNEPFLAFSTEKVRRLRGPLGGRLVSDWFLDLTTRNLPIYNSRCLAPIFFLSILLLNKLYTLLYE